MPYYTEEEWEEGSGANRVDPDRDVREHNGYLRRGGIVSTSFRDFIHPYFIVRDSSEPAIEPYGIRVGEIVHAPPEAVERQKISQAENNQIMEWQDMKDEQKSKSKLWGFL